MTQATVTSKGQITLPIEVRKALKLKAGDKLNFYQTKDGDYLVQLHTGSIMDLKGIIKKLGYVPEGPAMTIDEMNEAVGDAIMEDWERFEQQTREDRFLEASNEAHSQTALSDENS